MTTITTLTRLIVRNEATLPISSALLDALYATRRLTWQPEPNGCRRGVTCDYHSRKGMESASGYTSCGLPS